MLQALKTIFSFPLSRLVYLSRRNSMLNSHVSVIFDRALVTVAAYLHKSFSYLSKFLLDY
jgi:predicted ATPase